MSAEGVCRADRAVEIISLGAEYDTTKKLTIWSSSDGVGGECSRQWKNSRMGVITLGGKFSCSWKMYRSWGRPPAKKKNKLFS